MLVIPATGETPHTAVAESRPCRALAVSPRVLELRAIERLLDDPPLRAHVVVAQRTERALEIVASGAIDVVVCHLDTEPATGPALAGAIAAAGGPPVVLLGDAADALRLAAALRCGARGFLTMDCDVDELVDAVVGVRAGRLVISNRVLDGVVGRLTAAGPAAEARPRRRGTSAQVASGP